MNSPKIRFKGYTEDWEQRKLDDVTVKIGGGKTPSGGENAYVDAGIPLIRSQNVNDNKVDFEYIVYIDESTDKLMMNSRVFANDVLLNITGASIGRSAVYKGLDEANVNQHVCIIRPIEGYHPDFIQLNLASDRGQKQIKSSQAGGGREGLNFQQIGKMEFVFPTLDEQKQIGNYFNNIDHLITLHQRKCEQTKTLKKYMLQKMFPQEGQKVPEIRFEGFTGDWEQRKLGEIITEYKETVDSECTLPILTSSKTEGVILQEEHFGRKQQHDITGYNILPRNYCTYRNRSDGVDFTFNINKCCDKGIISKFYPVFSGKNSDVFFLSLVLNNSDGVVREIAYTCTGTGQKVLSFLDLQKMKVRVPSYDEQKEIAAYFENLDHLITLHQREYEKLQELKKFMLQNMFV